MPENNPPLNSVASPLVHYPYDKPRRCSLFLLVSRCFHASNYVRGWPADDSTSAHIQGNGSHHPSGSGVKAVVPKQLSFQHQTRVIFRPERDVTVPLARATE